MHQYLIKKGTYRGQIAEGKRQIIGRTPEGWAISGVRFPALGITLPDEPILHPEVAKHPQDTVHWEYLAIPHDRFDSVINVGDTLYVGVKNAVHVVNVVKIGEPYHGGYGIVNRKLTCQDVHDGKTRTINTPGDTIKQN
jgi:hypothetical protein